MSILFRMKGMQRSSLLALMICTVWFTGCATHKKTDESLTSVQSSTETFQPEPVQALSNLENWDLSALIAIRNLSKSNADSANLNWQQTRKNFMISLFGPMGTNAVKLYGYPGKVTLQKSDGKRLTASTPEAILAKETGWRLPVSNLYYWVRALPVPDMASKKSLDQNNHLQVLLQDGWRIQYLDYTKMNGIDLPRKIFLNNSDLSIKIIISKWQI